MSFSGLRVISLESRRAKEMETLIRRHNGDPFVAPSVKEKAIEQNDGAVSWVDQILAGEIETLVLMTGVGLKYMLDAALVRYSREQIIEVLGKVIIVARGPKPCAVLAEYGLRAHIIVPEPNTWREMVPLIEARPERRVALQEYGRPNPDFVAALEAGGRQVVPIAIYRWELPDDTGPMREAARRIADRQCEVVIFTTSIQLIHLLQIASEMGIEQDVRSALHDDLVVASVGPIMNAALAEQGLDPDIIPAHPKMGILVRAAAEQAAAALVRKRGAPLRSE